MLNTILTALRPIITAALNRLLADPEVAQAIEDQIVAELKAQLTTSTTTG